jgi:hypothetical protein
MNALPPAAPPLAFAASAAPLSKGDRVFLYPTHIDIPPDLGSPIVEDGFEVKSTAGCIIYTKHLARRVDALDAGLAREV